jgi:uncharacterized membrane protein
MWWWVLMMGCGGVESEAETADTAVSAAPATWAGVQSILDARCAQCHPATTGLDLHRAVADDVRSGAGRFVTAGDAEASPLWDAVAGSTLSTMMPPSGRLDPRVVSPIAEWIDAGASLE